MAIAKNIAHLSDKSRKFYKKILEDYALEENHLVILVKVCEMLDMAENARATIASDGMFTIDRYGTAKSHPAVKIMLDSTNSARLLLRELGLDLETAAGSRAPGLY